MPADDILIKGQYGPSKSELVAKLFNDRHHGSATACAKCPLRVFTPLPSCLSPTVQPGAPSVGALNSHKWASRELK